ncbi:TetR/AcrR family transcriptional regulator [Rhodococcus sp. BP-349]|uniref:TetR/AcrR family transcriptional regulator n=1 Tax=unclassified Rhodococcus (in: high G+C Gram-positive bacteria) TaxID=192944 RepID=UPI001C9B2641|nr:MULTISPECIES: TetR/AcrR family transcriptional regulator [unclassified Rhodococcus (in: high G+C Gram-positive bacteria)]MBY6538226.1 TetR/AcrR family transcriptional regulator [Rhodococcus sp. BP-363]MBY6542563.1 TetR/AcrR family transcriptional regulator [Rhodococcus sp. BP-369]MBY6561793.1 TetR/AcrR family transcriptional regulator [Rhodococcus sp. BP-370]MBY6576085.1 TetR/AcrR family transcriptional regulator [Rhodococcus sp. BP-364]MBY6585386.1 TetR/AcrR family transcriptional regulato
MPTPRETARTETMAAILSAARTQLAEVGPASLSLRAVAREIGMVSSAVYRYVASRDDLLTALIVQCYDEVGAALEDADPRGGKPLDRWVAVCDALRSWAAAHPHEYALLYGSPVPGYRAPRTTVVPATRPTLVLVSIVVDAYRSEPPTTIEPGLYSPARDFVVQHFRETRGEDVSGVMTDDLVARTLSAWITVFGAVSFERFGHLVGVTEDTGAFYRDIVRDLATMLDLSGR